MNALLADLVLAVHCALVVFIIGGLVAIWLGAQLRWPWVRRRRWRLLHVAAMVFVAIESVAGIACPLTVWEDALRGQPGERGELSFIARGLRYLLYYDLPAWVFTAAYVAFAVAIILTYRLVPPVTPQVTAQK